MSRQRLAITDKERTGAAAPVLSVDDLRVSMELTDGMLPIVRGVTFSVASGKTLGIIGESGSGKSMTARAIMGLLPRRAARVTGSVRFCGTELVGLPDKRMKEHRGRDISLVLQDPMRSLNPTMRVGRQLTEALRSHQPLSRREAKARAIDLLRMVRIPAAERRFGDYPYQLSGGMRQRVTIAIALSCSPKLLIMDEPTTALDVTTQAQIMDLLCDLQNDNQMALVLISHDIGLASWYTDEIAVMYAGRLVERAPTPQLVGRMRMPYTKALFESAPVMSGVPHASLAVIEGQPPDPRHPPTGCRFHPRCRNASEKCAAQEPDMEEGQSGHRWACWNPV